MLNFFILMANLSLFIGIIWYNYPLLMFLFPFLMLNSPAAEFPKFDI